MKINDAQAQKPPPYLFRKSSGPMDLLFPAGLEAHGPMDPKRHWAPRAPEPDGST